ncbi:hypothetical protein AGMMS49949_05990 [Alphaproteobacteria bacterium]|nr:hypothetical protein AGMMS49949_05990 [Alphaproteobacteria bacterium]
MITTEDHTKERSIAMVYRTDEVWRERQQKNMKGIGKEARGKERENGRVQAECGMQETGQEI